MVEFLETGLLLFFSFLVRSLIGGEEKKIIATINI